CWATALELDIMAHVVQVQNLAQQDGASVTELRHEMTELVTGIGRCYRHRIRWKPIAGENRDALRRCQRVGIDAELPGEPAIDPHKSRCRGRRRFQPRIEALWQASIAV